MKDGALFCAYSDQSFLPRALAMFSSLRARRPSARLALLCLDRETERAARRLALPALEPLALPDLERADPEAARTARTRSRLDYFLTLTPVLPRWLLGTRPEFENVIYLDGDLLFFADPQPLLDELAGADIGITEHRFSASKRACLNLHGRFNDGWVCFRRGAAARACLDWWRQRCLEWCHNHVEDGKFTEQKYLDDWPRLFPGVRPLAHPGANVAPWNVEDRPVRDAGGRPEVEGRPLLFYHFSGFRPLVRGVYELLRKDQGFAPDAALRELVYRPYVAALRESERRLRAAGWRGDLRAAARDPEPFGAAGRWGRAALGLLSGRCLAV